MGKKSRIKKQRHEQTEAQSKENEIATDSPRGAEAFLLWLFRISVAITMLTPFIIRERYYFPFVGPKGLFLLGGCEVVFFIWLILALHYKKYRPNLNKVLIAFSFFLVVLILSSIFGVDPSRSFWSKYERMTGLLVWLHLFGFFIATSSSFKKLSDWRGIFLTSTVIATFISFLTLLGEAGVSVYEKGGSSLGNTSFLGTYLLFHVFFALYIFFKTKNKYIKWFAITAIVICGLGIYYAGARAATISMLGGLSLVGLLYLTFKPKKRNIRIAGTIALLVSAVVILTAIVLLFIPGTFVSNKFIELTTASRAVNWNMAWKGFAERPLLGWGPENYTVLFPKFFNPCLFTLKCGSEIWFDRTHNIVLDTLATTGILGLITYLGMFFTMIFVLYKKYRKRKLLDFWTFAIFSALLIAYFVQNLTVFDMPASLLMITLIVSFIGFIATEKEHESSKVKQIKAWPIVILAIVFLVVFFEFVIQPSKTDTLVIDAVTTGSPQERLEYYKATFDASPMGKYQIRDFFAQHSQDFVRKNLNNVPKETLMQEFDFVLGEMQKTIEATPIDFRATLKISQVYNVYSLLDINKVALAEQYARRAIELSPRNQQAYWSLTQALVYKKDFDGAVEAALTAVDLEPEWLDSYKIAIQVLQTADRYDEAKTLSEKAVEINPEWAGAFDDMITPPPVDK